MLVFEERGKPEYPEKNLSEQRRETTTNSTHELRRVRARESIPSHIGRRKVLSPLRHPLLPLIKAHSVGFNDYVRALNLMISQWSSYKNKHTHRGVVLLDEKESQQSIQRWRELVCGGWANCLMKTKLTKYSWLSKNDNKSHVIERKGGQPFNRTSVDAQSNERYDAESGKVERVAERIATWVALDDVVAT